MMMLGAALPEAGSSWLSICATVVGKETTPNRVAIARFEAAFVKRRSIRICDIFHSWHS